MYLLRFILNTGVQSGDWDWRVLLLVNQGFVECIAHLEMNEPIRIQSYNQVYKIEFRGIDVFFGTSEKRSCLLIS